VDFSNTDIDGDLVSDPFLVCSESLEKIVLKGCAKLTGGKMLENLSPFVILRYFSIAGSKGLTHLIDVNFIPVSLILREQRCVYVGGCLFIRWQVWKR